MGNMTIFAGLMGVIVFSAICLAYQVYKMVLIDARSRGIKWPGFWGLVTVGGQGGEGILLYLIWRKKYPVIEELGPSQLREMEKRKKISGLSLVFATVAFIGIIINMFLYR